MVRVAILAFSASLFLGQASANMMPPPDLGKPKPAPVTPATPAAPAKPAAAAPAAPVTPAAAQPSKTPAAAVDIAAFYGQWRGTAKAQSETDEDFSTTNRDVAVTINPTDTGGFVLSWSTLQRQKGDPKAPLEVMKSTSIDFVPSANPGRWRSKADADPYRGGIVYWARLERDILIVSSFTIDSDGKPELHTYRRKVTGDDMRLDFSNVKDGQVIRQVAGSLRRVGGKAK